MPTGRIKYYNFDKGFGFIAQDSSDADVFLHSSAIKQSEYEELRVGQRVKYNIIEGEKGLVAQNVEVLLTPTERRWLRQGKAIIPRGYAGFPGQHQGPFLGGEGASAFRGDASRSKPTRSRHDTSLTPSKPEATHSSQTTAVRDFGDAVTPAQDVKEQTSKQLSFGDLYILKQINFETPMFFVLYNDVQLPATVLEMTLSRLTLNSNGNEQHVAKTDVKYCYKDVDAERVQAAVEIDEEVKAQQLTQLTSDDQACDIDTEGVQEARKNKAPIEVTLREGDIFRGIIDWVSPYEIKLILANAAKVVIFRHAIYTLSLD